MATQRIGGMEAIMMRPCACVEYRGCCTERCRRWKWKPILKRISTSIVEAVAQIALRGIGGGR